MPEAIKILIVEDDMIIAADIAMHLTSLGYAVSGIVPRGEAALQSVKDDPPDLLLLDINLKGRMDGVETAGAILEQYSIPIIYLTANADDATFRRAKTTRPQAFISKPFEKIDLQRAIELAVDPISESKETTAADEIEREESFILSDRIFVRDKERMVKLFLKDILYLEAERNYCRIHTTEKEYLISAPLKSIEEKIETDFLMRVHRSFVINLTQLDEVAENHLVIRKKAIPVSKSYKEDFLRRIRLL